MIDYLKILLLVVLLSGIGWVSWTLKLQNAEITALRSQISSQTALIKKQKVQELNAELPTLLDKLNESVKIYKSLRGGK